MIKLAIDAMGSDLGSKIVIQPCLDFVDKHSDVELYVYGSQQELEALNNHPRIKVIGTTQVMEMCDGALASRRKKDSSMVRAITDVKEHLVDGVVSCGSTGALLSSSSLILTAIKDGVRPAIITVLPNKNKTGVVVLDVGANAENTCEQLVNFGYLGKAYASAYMNMDNPRVGLLNIGSEEKKGDDIHKQTYQALQQTNLNFIGNVEGKDILSGTVDVIITDGFTGNVMLKTMEGASAFLMSEIKQGLVSNGFMTKIGALLIKKALKKTAATLDPNQFGGALIIGVNGVVVKGHGSSNELAFSNALKQLDKLVRADIVNKIKEEIK